MPYAQFAASSQFYLYGCRHFNQKGYERHAKAYADPGVIDSVDLRGQVFIVTGANAGLGKEITKFLAKRGASVRMLCRSRERGEAALREVAGEAPGAELALIQADCSLERDVRRCWEEFAASGSRLDGLVCNAGALLNEKTITDEGVEVTLAAHLLFGAYLLGSLALPLLAQSRGRLVLVSSGGMYNTRFPDWDTACSLHGTYDGQMAYAHMKRGQVLLAEQWAESQPEVKVVSCHPGWADTEAVEKAYGAKKSLLEPLRSPWEGAEGICWLLCCPRERLESGAFYLDRSPQAKHMGGPFFTEGSFTKNSPAEAAELMARLEAWAGPGRPPAEELAARHAAHASGEAVRLEGKLRAASTPLDLDRFMGRWFVISHIPTFLDKGTANGVERYSWDPDKKQINVEFSYMDAECTKTSTISQTAKVVNDENTEWKLRVKLGLIPISLAYIIVHFAEDYSSCIVGNPDRSLLYIMARKPEVQAADLEGLKNMAESAGYPRRQIKDVPQIWGAGLPSA